MPKDFEPKKLNREHVEEFKHGKFPPEHLPENEEPQLKPHLKELHPKDYPQPHVVDSHHEPLKKDLKHEEHPHVRGPLKQEDIEVMINLCGSKEELIVVLNHINRMIIDMPKEVRSEVKVKKLK